MKGVACPLVVLCLCLMVGHTDQNVRKKRQILPDQPRIMTQDGNLVFMSGTNHNITFRSGAGGGIMLDNLDIKSAVAQTQANKAAIQATQGNISSIQGSLQQVSMRVATAENRLNNQNNNDLTTQINSLTARVQTLERSNQRSGRNNVNQRQMRRLRRRVTTLENTVRNLQSLLTTNECLSSPCRNGGTCVDMYNGYFCRCPVSWQGANCDQDVNECIVYAGTDLACQNGATCINTQGSFRCQCTANWHGIHCSEQHDDCTGASHAELCGHGTCINVDRAQPGQPRYRCICEDGWTTDGTNPECSQDVDECASGARCSANPPVRCLNYPGSFMCGPCPAGYTGNGYTCSDINECAYNNGGCSMSPLVQCTNTIGSRACGPCPSGYQGDGVTCSYVGTCTVNNGGCHPLAVCLDDTGGFGQRCQCPVGYVGSGVGPNGCVQQSSAGGCRSNPCQNGAACSPVGSSGFACTCQAGYSGPTCNVTVNSCASNPCQNGGTCTPRGTSYTCQCTEDFTGTNCEQAQQACGGYLRGESGSFRYPRTTGVQYPHRVSCAWAITTSPDKILRVTFPTFHLEYHQECRYDFLQIHDGPTASSHIIGKYCGTTPPNGGSINSTHNQLYFWFKSDASVTGDGFEVQWTSHTPVCGAQLSGAEHGAISSPGYPGNYPHNRDCVWTVAVSPGSNIMFTFATLALEHHDNCSFDYLQIRDGMLEDDPILGTYCSTPSPLPVPIYTTGPYAFIRFHSDASLSDTGFHVTYAAQTQGRQGCGGSLTGDEGEVTSPGYPTAYQHSAQCVWTITVSNGSNVHLTFVDFDLETSSSCSYDNLIIRDGIDEMATPFGQFCGTDTPADITSSGNVLFLELTTDESISGRGFKAQWTSGCGGTYRGTEGQIQSPNFPDPYPSNKACDYRIEVPESSTILLTFSSFGLEPDDDCAYDYVEIYDGTGTDAPMLGSRLCGTNRPSEVRSTGNTMIVKFVTDGSVNNDGFQATYTAVEGAVACGGVFNDNSGIISSPGHPNTYPHGINCTWYITVDPGMIVRLSFNMFSFERSRRGICNYDYVEVFDNSTVYTPSSLGRYCGSDTPDILTSSSNVLTIYMVTDGSVSREGFHANYVALNVSTVCGTDLTTSSGVITSPNYPNNYPHDRQCEWTITVSDGNQIAVNVTDFEMEGHRDCNYDYLEFRNGGYLTSPLIGKYCGSMVVPPILSHSNRLYIRFRADHSRSARGFRLEYDGASSGCGGDLTTSTGAIVSPNYPQPYSHLAECYWTITVSRGSAVSIFFVDFDVETGSNCRYDYLEIREGGPNGRSLGKLCGRNNPEPIMSNSNRLWLKYRTDSSISGRGFRLQYHASCNSVLTGHHGVIESPNFPNEYHHQANCTWVINAPMGNKINISFAAFNLERHRSCNYDRLQVRDGGDASASVLNTYCGDTLPEPFQSSGESLWLNFISDASLAHEGFRLEWIVDGCGGYLYGNTGVITSPNYPEMYPSRHACLWYITVDTGKRIHINITDFDFETMRNCMFDRLEIFLGSDTTGPRLTQLCHGNTERQPDAQRLYTTGNQAVVLFKSDISISGRGFSLNYEAVDGGCGGNFTARSGTIMSINYPNNYEDQTECEWLITVKRGHTVELTFTDFEVEGGSCTYDSVNIYDGPNSNATLLASLCGHTLPDPPTYNSSGNQMFVRMKTDSSVNHKGFSATYTTGCGGRLDANTDGEIFSPNYPGAYPFNTRCVWIISSMPAELDPDTTPNTGALIPLVTAARRVSLTFTHMDIDSECTRSYVAVNEGVNSVTTVNGSDAAQNRYCGNSVPATITSAGSALTVIFESTNSYLRGSGFRAIYTSSYSSCGGVFTAQSGRFMSPGYPSNYPMSIECEWQINVAAGNSLALSFPNFQLDAYGNVNGDYLEIRTPDVRGQLLGRWTGDQGPSNVTAVGGAWIKFRSDEQYSDTGFTAEWSGVFGGSLTGDNGNIESPDYPAYYPASVNYRWTILASQNMRVRITFNVFALEGVTGQTCRFDYLEIFDGTPETGTSVGKFCGRDLPDPIYTLTNEVTIVFVTDSTVELQGFSLTWNAVAPEDVTTPSPSTTPIPGCGGQLVGADMLQNLTTPNYPDNYDNRLDCVWTITVSAGNTVIANITDIDLETHGRCYFDYLIFYDGDSTSSTVLSGPFCGTSGNSELIQSSGNVMTVKFHTDYSLTRQGAVVTYQKGCGGRMRETTGIIKSPQYPSNYPANQNCSWSVQVGRGKTVELQFNSQFNIADSGSCNNDYLLLLNGLTFNSPPLFQNGSSQTNGRYCGTSAPPTLETSSNNLFVNFVSDSSGSGTGFSLTYREKAFACGGQLRLTHAVNEGYIMSPNYPENYPHNVDCGWVIIAPASERVQLDFVGNFSIERHSRCEFDYVEFHDGGTSYSPRIGEPQCGNDLPGTVFSTGNILFVRFRTDESIPHAGFKAKYSIATCGGRITAARGELTSPNFPGSYDSNADCEWVVMGPAGHYLTLNITNFRLARTANCSGDFLEIRDGNSTSRSMLRECGARLPFNLETSDNMAYIRFKTDGSNVDSGFRIAFQASLEECGGQLTTPTGVITSPNYPGQYAHSRVCVWDIIVSMGRKVTLTFNDFRLEASHSTGFCRWDFVEIVNGLIPMSPRLNRFCGETVPDPISSSGNTMRIIFHTDGSVSSGGFRATYTSNEEAECGGYLTESPGNITSPGFDNSTYDHSLHCIWQLHNHRGDNSSVRLWFTVMRLEHSSGCIFDFVEIREGVDNNGVLVDKFCGNRTHPGSIVLPVSDVWIRFRSDLSISHDGFQLMYEYTNCGGQFTAPQGVITSPNYPQQYAHNDACAWHITAPEGARIRLRFTDFDFENHTSCQYDHLKILNGGLPDSPEIGKFCGGNPPDEFVSQSNAVRLIMFTDINMAGRGFRLEYSFDTNACGGMFHSERGNISTPNYPSSYPHNVECRWDINVNRGFIVTLNFVPPFDLEANDCAYDYVEAFDSLSNGTLVSLGRWCHNENPPSLRSSSNRMVVVFRSDGDTNGNGFQATWDSECSGTFTGNFGYIYSPNFPNNYPNNLKCNYTISPGPGKHIAVEFIDFELERLGTRCIHDYVKIFSGNDTNGRSLGTWCGTEKPDVVTSVDNMLIQFWTDSSLVYKGFQARYYADECGGVFTEPRGVISSPTHPFRYNNNANCSYAVTVQENRVIKFKFFSFELEAHASCRFDSVNFYDGPDTNADLIGSYCGTMENIPQSISTTGNQMYVTFITDSSVSRGGFSGGYWTTFGPAQGCGGTLRQSSGQLSSLDADGDGFYEHQLDCVWYIYVGDNKAVTFNITNIDIEDHRNCAWDYLAVYDGETADAPELGKFCGQSRPNRTLIASSNVIMVVFHSDMSSTGRGFNATFGERNLLCGGAYNATDQPQTLSSPNYPNPSTQPLRCSWILDSGDSNTQISVQLNSLRLQSSPNCEGEYLTIRDRPKGDNGQEFHYCGTALPPAFESRGQQVRILYNLPLISSSQGFQLTYQIADCNKNFSMPSGRITSPSYPDVYPRNVECTVRVRAPVGTTIALYFRAFGIEPHANCRYDYLQIMNSTMDVVAMLCGQEIPSPVFLPDNEATLKFKTDLSVQRTGYDITYVSSSQGSGCGGNITHIAQGVITSPNYPGNFSEAATCSWTIYPPARQLMTIRVSDASMPEGGNCDTNYVVIYSGLRTTDRVISRFCDRTPFPRRLSDPFLVQFVSSGQGTAPVFRLEFY